MAAIGVDLLRFNYRGLWGNDGAFTLTNALADLDAALDFLTAAETIDRFGLDVSRLVVIGYSFGTAVGLVGAARDDRVPGVVSLAPCDHGYFDAELADPNTTLRAFFDAVTERLFGADGPIDHDPSIFLDDLRENVDTHRFVPRAEALLDTQLLFLVGLNDEVCHAEDHFCPLYRRLRGLSHPALSAHLLGMDHGYAPVGAATVRDFIARWMTASFPEPVGRGGANVEP